MLISILNSESLATCTQSTEPSNPLTRLPVTVLWFRTFFSCTQIFLFSTECIQEDGDKDQLWKNKNFNLNNQASRLGS